MWTYIFCWRWKGRTFRTAAAPVTSLHWCKSNNEPQPFASLWLFIHINIHTLLILVKILSWPQNKLQEEPDELITWTETLSYTWLLLYFHYYFQLNLPCGSSEFTWRAGRGPYVLLSSWSPSWRGWRGCKGEGRDTIWKQFSKLWNERPHLTLVFSNSHGGLSFSPNLQRALYWTVTELNLDIVIRNADM